MGNLLAYSGITAKVRAMDARLLTENDFVQIASCSTVPEIITYLKDKPAYSYLLNEVDEHNLHRGDIEKILVQSLYHDYSRLYRFGQMPQKRFLELYLKRYEIDIINYCLRIVFNHYTEPFDLNYKKPFFDAYSSLSIDQLIESGSLKEFIVALKGTEYYMPLAKLQDSPEAGLFDYDLALTLYYYSTVWKQRKKIFRKQELEFITKACGTEIDLLNLQWIYRAKKYYNMLPPDIYNMLIPIHYRIHLPLLKELVEAPTINELLKLFDKIPYRQKYPIDESVQLEDLYDKVMLELHRNAQRKNPYSISSVFYYLHLKERELKRLTNALECIRYGLSSAETLKIIGGTTNP